MRRQRKVGHLLVVTGPPGAGKSTVAAIVTNRVEPSAQVAGDAFFECLVRGATTPWLPESNEQNEVVTQAAAAAAGTFASGGFTTVYDGVVHPAFLPSFTTATGLDRLDYVVLLPSVERCAARVKQRRNHGFSDQDATRRMHDELAGAGIIDRHVLREPPDRPDEVAELVLAANARGTLTYRGP